MQECEVFLMVDADGNYVVGSDTDQLAERYSDDIGNDDATPRRIVKLVVNVPLPKVSTCAVNVTIPDELPATATSKMIGDER